MQKTSMQEKEDDLQDSLKEGEERVKGVISEIDQKLKRGQEQIEKVVAGVDKQMHKNPWPIVGGVAVGCILLGFMMGLSKKN